MNERGWRRREKRKASTHIYVFLILVLLCHYFRLPLDLIQQFKGNKVKNEKERRTGERERNGEEGFHFLTSPFLTRMKPGRKRGSRKGGASV